jgi:hypothetical protein
MSVIINGSAGVTTNSGAVYDGISRGTSVASTSGTSIDFTSIPSWVKRITVIFNAVSTNGTSNWLIQAGTGGTPTSSGYVSASNQAYATSNVATTSTAGFILYPSGATSILSGSISIVNISGNIWIASGTVGGNYSGGTAMTVSTGGTVTLGGTLNMVRITTANGTDTFDAGSINILYE